MDRYVVRLSILAMADYWISPDEYYRYLKKRAEDSALSILLRKGVFNFYTSIHDDSISFFF